MPGTSDQIDDDQEDEHRPDGPRGELDEREGQGAVVGAEQRMPESGGRQLHMQGCDARCCEQRRREADQHGSQHQQAAQPGEDASRHRSVPSLVRTRRVLALPPTSSGPNPKTERNTGR